jgi:D-3-phosphoglycerate dehydrogenase
VKIAVLSRVHESGLAVLRDAGFDVVYEPECPQEKVSSMIRDAAAVVVRSKPKIRKEEIDAAPGLRFIGRAGVGTDNIDSAAAKARGIHVANSPLATTQSVAEHVLALMLSAAHNVVRGAGGARQGKWLKSSLVGTELAEKTVGIVGFGNIGERVAALLAPFRCRILAYDVVDISPKAAARGAHVSDLETIYRESDFITFHVPLLESTRHMVSAKELGMMKPGAILVNTSRGGVVDEAALAKALGEGRIRAACLDVFEKEPLADSPLQALDNAVLTPHIAASTEEAQERAGIEIAEKCVAALRSG